MYVCMYVCVGMNVCMYVRLYVSSYVRMYVKTGRQIDRCTDLLLDDIHCNIDQKHNWIIQKSQITWTLILIPL